MYSSSQASTTTRAWSTECSSSPLSSSRRIELLNRSMWQLCCGPALAVKTGWTCGAAGHSWTVPGMNSRPLSARMIRGLAGFGEQSRQVPGHRPGTDRTSHQRTEGNAGVLDDDVQDPQRTPVAGYARRRSHRATRDCGAPRAMHRLSCHHRRSCLASRGRARNPGSGAGWRRRNHHRWSGLFWTPSLGAVPGLRLRRPARGATGRHLAGEPRRCSHRP